MPSPPSVVTGQRPVAGFQPIARGSSVPLAGSVDPMLGAGRQSPFGGGAQEWRRMQQASCAWRTAWSWRGVWDAAAACGRQGCYGVEPCKPWTTFDVASAHGSARLLLGHNNHGCPRRSTVGMAFHLQWLHDELILRAACGGGRRATSYWLRGRCCVWPHVLVSEHVLRCLQYRLMSGCVAL